MNDRVVNLRTASKVAARAISLAWLLLGTLHSHAATPERRMQATLKARPDVINDLAVLAQNQPRKCAEDKKSESGVHGWRQSAMRCAWQNRLQMRRWETNEESDPMTCLSKQAAWWSWGRSGIASTIGPVAWNAAWSAQSLLDDSGLQKRVAIIERSAHGSWIATEWRWTPSTRTATRKWEEGRWKLLTDAATEMRQAASRDRVPQEAILLKAAWEKNLKGRAGEVSGENWFWQRDGLCLRMETVGLSQAQLHLPYSKDDGRLEQRAAMQLRLARTYPKAIWLTQFRLLPLPDSAGRGGAKYEAIWMENATVRGQLWMPSKGDGAVFRVRIAVALPAKKDSGADAAAIAAIARSIDRELISLATTWTLDNEQ